MTKVDYYDLVDFFYSWFNLKNISPINNESDNKEIHIQVQKSSHDLFFSKFKLVQLQGMRKKGRLFSCYTSNETSNNISSVINNINDILKNVQEQKKHMLPIERMLPRAVMVIMQEQLRKRSNQIQ